MNDEKRSAKDRASGDDAPATVEESGKEASRAELLDALIALVASASRPMRRDSCDREQCLIPLAALKKAELLVPENVRRGW